MMIRMSLLVLAWLALVGNARAIDENKIAIERDITYTKAAGRELKLDLARPTEGDGPFPVVLVIHGGGWRAGDKADNHPALMEFARRGYVAVSPQYRLAPKDPFPAQVHDVKAAVRWIKGHAKDYKVDPARVGAMGFSAGGHLALMLGTTSAADGLEGEVSSASPDSSVQAVVNFSGPTDLTARDFPDVSRSLIKDFLGGDPKDRSKEVTQASPIKYLSKGDAPALSFQGTKDPLVPVTQATALAELMSDAGVPGRVELFVGAGHGWGGEELKHSMTGTFEFFDRYLKQPDR
jgi:acetyl esterase/lipase